MKTLALFLCLLCSPAFAQQSWWNAVAAQQAPVAGGGPPNNLALVSGHFGGVDVNNGSSTSLAYTFDASHQVASGNIVMVGVSSYNGGAQNYAAGDLTKTAGTATIGAVALDCATNQPSSNIGCAIYRVPVTGSGTLTLTFTSNGGGVYGFIGCGEFTGQNATPFDSGKTNSGAGWTATSGSVSSSVPGMIFYICSVNAGGNYTGTNSDNVIFQDTNGSSDSCGIVQYKLINSSPNTVTNNTDGASSVWINAWAVYKSS